MKTSLTHSSKCAGRSLRSIAVMLLAACNLALAGCSGLVSGTSSPANPPPTALDITNVQAASTTTSTSQVVWTTNVAADSAVDYGTSTSYGSSTPVSSAMVTSHQVTLSGLAAGTTYYYQVRSTDSKGNHGKSGGHSVKIAGFSISGTINPATGGSGATLTLGGAANAATTTDSVGNYTFAGQPNGTFTVVPSHAGFTFTPSSQSTTVNGANVSGMNFTANAAPVVPTITTQPGNQTVTAGQTATFTVVAAGTAPLAYQWQKNGVNIAGATASSYTTPATTTSDSGSTFRAVVTNTAGTATSGAATLTVNPAPVCLAQADGHCQGCGGKQHHERDCDGGRKQRGGYDSAFGSGRAFGERGVFLTDQFVVDGFDGQRRCNGLQHFPGRSEGRHGTRHFFPGRGAHCVDQLCVQRVGL